LIVDYDDNTPIVLAILGCVKRKKRRD